MNELDIIEKGICDLSKENLLSLKKDCVNKIGYSYAVYTFYKEMLKEIDDALKGKCNDNSNN